MKKVLWIIIYISFANLMYSQSASCSTAGPICASTGTTYAASTGAGSAPSGPNYGCLGSVPNPTYFTITVGNTGSITLSISNSNNRDIDWILWGPFTNGNNAYNACGAMGTGGANGSIVVCNYTTATSGNITFSGTSGQVYMLMVTNFSNRNTNISITQSGAGSICCPTNITMPQTKLCVGQTMTMSPTTGGTWTSSNTSVATITNSGVVTSIASGTAFFTFTNSGGCSNSSQTLTVSAPPIGGTASSNQSICSGTQPSNLSLTGSSGNIQWQKSTDNSTFTDIVGATSATLSGATIGNLTSTTYFRAKVSNSPCTDVFSNTITITVNTNPVAGTATSNQTICNGTQPSNLSLSGSSGNVQWQKSTDNSTFTDIVGATSATLSGATIGNLTSTTYFRAKVSNSPCVDVFSNVITITVETPSISGPISVAVGSTIQLTGNLTPSLTNPWISSNTIQASVSTSGLVTGIAVGSVTITYTTINGCKATQIVSIYEPVCFQLPTSPGVGGISSIHGITDLARAGSDNGNWPMIRKGAYTVLEAKTKGFVITRVASTSAIANPIEGMIVYDQSGDCLSIYDGTSWKCYNTQTCP